MDTTFPTSRKLKEQARLLHRSNAARLTRLTLFYWLLGSALTTLISYAAAMLLPVSQDALSAPELFLSLLLNLFGVVLVYGYDRWLLWTSRGEQLRYDALLDGFSEVGRVILARIWVVLYLLPWVFLLSLTAMLLFVLLSDWMVYTLIYYGFAALTVEVFLFVGVCFLAFLPFLLRYELTNFLLAEFDQLTPAQAVRRSAALMRGRIGRLFRLKLSFLGWHLLQFGLATAIALAVAYPQLVAYYQAVETVTDSWELVWYTQQQLQAVLNSGLVTLLTMAVSLPLFLYVTPYQRLAEAEFYTQLIRPEPQAPSGTESF